MQKAADFPSGAHLQLLQSSLKGAAGMQVKSGLSCSCCVTVRIGVDAAELEGL